MQESRIGWRRTILLTALGLALSFALYRAIESMPGWIKQFDRFSHWSRVTSGRIVDVSTGRPVVGARIEIREPSRSGRSRGTRAVSSGDGAFHLTWSGSDPATLVVTQPGYGPQVLDVWNDTMGDLPLAPLDPDTSMGMNHMLTATTVRDSFVTDWNFDRPSESRDTTTCDLSFRGSVVRGETVTIRSYGRGGIQIAADTSRWNPLYRFGIECSAPLDGYQRSVTFSSDSRRVVCFARTRDGAHYAKFLFDPNVWRLPSASEPPVGEIGVVVRFNRSGGRGLCDCGPNF